MERKFDCIIGIDPGANGGIATWREGHNVTVARMPKELEQIKGYLDYIKGISKNPLVILEKIQLRPDDMIGGKGFRIQQLLSSFQQLKDFINFAGVPYILVHPISWQSYLSLRKKGEEKAERKNRYKRFSAQLYPGVKVTLWNADALLLMHFGRLKQERDEKWLEQNLPSARSKDKLWQ